MTTQPNSDEVICPGCAHQFRAIPVNVQQLMLDAGFEPPFTGPPATSPGALAAFRQAVLRNRCDGESEFARGVQSANQNLLQYIDRQLAEAPTPAEHALDAALRAMVPKKP